MIRLEEVSSSGRSARFKTAPAGHIDGWDFEMFPRVVLVADPDELEKAAGAAATPRAG